MSHQKPGFLSTLFRNRATQKPLPPIPGREEIVSMMFDKGLDSFCDMVVKVIYSHDNTKRFVILKSANGYFKYTYEEIYTFNEEEWMLIGRQPDALPAMWMAPYGFQGTSLYFDYDSTMRELIVSPEYKRYFSDI